MTCRTEEGAGGLSIVTTPLYTKYLSIHGIHVNLGVSLNPPSVETEDAFLSIAKQGNEYLSVGAGYKR